MAKKHKTINLEKSKELILTESGIRKGQEIILTTGASSKKGFHLFGQYRVIGLKKSDADSVFYDKVVLENDLTGESEVFSYQDCHGTGRRETSNGVALGEEITLIANNKKDNDLKVGRKFLVAGVDDTMNYKGAYEEIGLWDPMSHTVRWYLLKQVKANRIMDANEDDEYQFGDILRMIEDNLIPNGTTLRKTSTGVSYTLSRKSDGGYSFIDDMEQEATLSLNDHNLRGSWKLRLPREKRHTFTYKLFPEGENVLNLNRKTETFFPGDAQQASGYQFIFTESDQELIKERHGADCFDGLTKTLHSEE